jgi:hypothetical protein
MSFPNYQSLLSAPIQTNNFIAIQSAQLSVSNAGVSGSQSVTFTAVPGMQRITAKITNSGSKGCYVASGPGAATAVTSSSTPTPASSVTNIVATCDFIAPGSILTQDYVQGTTTFAAICAGSDTTTLEISVGFGQ